MSVFRVSLPFVVAISFAFIASCVDAAEPLRVYIANDDHTDYYWTRDGEAYHAAFLEMLDYYLDLADATESERPEHQSRFNCDGSLWMWTYERGRSPEQFERLISRIRDGHITMPLNPLPLLHGGVPAEAIIRGLYYPGSIERRYNLRFPVVTGMEDPTLPYGLGSLWAGAGARYCYHGRCNCVSPLKDTPHQRDHEVYWWVGPDGRRLLTKWYSQPVHSYHMGGYAEAFEPAKIVDYVTTEAHANGFREQNPYDIVGVFGYGGDRFLATTREFVDVAKQKTDDQRMIIVSNIRDFFEDFEKTYGDTLPSQSVAFGNDWDLQQGMLIEATARVRRAVEKLRAAEALATAISLRKPGFMKQYEKAAQQTWMDIGLFYEHNWCFTGRVGPQGRLPWVRALTDRIEDYVARLHADAVKTFGKMLPQSSDQRRFYVFNPLSWSRTDYADVAIPDQDACRVIDLGTNAEVPHQFLPGQDGAVLRILARDVPPLGYKVFEIRPGAGASFAPAAEVTGNVVDHEFYRLTLRSNGSIRSLIDKKNGERELTQRYRGLNELLMKSEGTLSVASVGPVSVTIACNVDEPLRHRTRITLYKDLDRISIANEITENFDGKQVWDYKFALADPVVWHEETGAIIKAALTTDGGRYSPTNARYDWLTLNHFANVSENGRYGVTLSNADCSFMQIGESTTVFKLDTSRATLKVLAGGDIQGGFSRFPLQNQGGDDYFLQRFALTTHREFSATESMRFSLEHQNPLVTGPVTGAADAASPRPSLLEIDNPNVLVWSLKPSEEGIDHGVIVRVWNLSDEIETFTLAPADFRLREARETTHIETDLKTLPMHDGSLTATLQAQQIQTYRLIPEVEAP